MNCLLDIELLIFVPIVYLALYLSLSYMMGFEVVKDIYCVLKRLKNESGIQ